MRLVWTAVVCAGTCLLAVSGCSTPAKPETPKAVASAPATAAPKPQAPKAIASATPTAAEPKKICKRMTVMGSNFPKTVCSTAEEWAAFNAKTHESVDAYDKDRKEGNTLNDTGGDLGRGN